MQIELLQEKDLSALQKMIVKTMQKSFVGFYPQHWIDYSISRQTTERLNMKRETMHFYVIKERGKIVACGAISGDYYGNTKEASLFSIFVDTDMQGRGYGRAIMKAIEGDEYFKRAKRIECPASINALPFYMHFGYKHKNDEIHFENGSFALEKFNN